MYVTYPPTPACAKAGAAPGTTGGVELGSRVASKGTCPQTIPTLPQASKATTLTVTATTSRLPFARPQTPQTLPTRPQASKATTLTATIHAPAICLSGGSRLPFARPQIQGNNSYSYSYYFQTAVCSASNPPNASNPPAGLQGNNSYYSYYPQASKASTLTATIHAPAIYLSGGSRLPFARPQIQGNNSYSYSNYFQTAVCSASNPPNASNPPAGLQGNNSYYSYDMPLPSVFQGVQDCRLPARLKTAVCPPLKPPKPSRRPPRHLPSVFQGVQDCRLPPLKPPKPPKPSRKPPRQQLLQLHALKPPKRFQPSRKPPRQQLLQLRHAPAICLSRGPRLPFARPQIQGNNSYSYSYYFKTAVCSASNPPNASNPPAGLQGNNSYSYDMPLPSVFQGVQDCRLPALKSKATTLTATATTSRLPFARPQTPQTLPTRPQASKATTLITATTCPCHLSFRGFKTAVCPPSNPPNPLAGLQGTCHLFFKGFKTAVCPPSNPSNPPNPPNPPAGLQGNNSYSYMPSNPANASNPPAGLQGNNSYSYYMPLPSVFQGVQDCRLPALKPPKPSRRPPRQPLLQLHALKPPKRFQPSRRPPRQQLLQLLHAPAICFSSNPPAGLQGNNSYSYSYYFQTAVCSASNPPNASNPPTGLQGNNSYYSYYMPLPSVFQGVQDCRLPALKPPKPSRRPPRHLPSVFQGVQDCRLPALKPPKPPKPSRRPPRQQLLQLHALKPPKRFQPSRRPPRQQLLQLLHAPAICFSGGSRLPFARPQTPINPPYYFKTAVCSASNPPNASNPPAGLQGNNSYSYNMPLPSVFQGVQDCRLPALKPPKPSRRPPRHLPSVFQGVQDCRLPALKPLKPPKPPKPPKPSRKPPRQQLLQLHALKPPKRFQPSCRPPRQHLLQLLHAPAICFSDCCLPALKHPKPSRRPPRQPLLQLHALKPKRFQPSRRPPRQQLLQLLHAPAICFSGGSRLPFARPQTPQTLPQTPQTLPQASKQGTCHLFFKGFKTAVCPPSNPSNPPNPPNPPAGLQGNNSYSYMPSNPANASNPPAGLQGNNSYSYYMPLPSVFQGVQDCRLPALKPPKPSRRPPRQQLLQLHALKPPKRFQPSRRPPRQQLLQLLHAPAICFSGGSRLPFARPQTPQTLQTQLLQLLHAPAICFSRGSRLPFARPQTPQTLPQASKAPAICFSRGSRLPFARPQTPQTLSQASKAPAICFSRGSRLPFARPQTPQTPQTLPQASKATTLTATCPQTPQTLPTLPQASKATTLTATTCPCHLFFRGFKTAVCPPSNPHKPPLLLQDCRLLGLKPPKRFQPSRRPPRQQLLQLLHAPAICLSGGSRLRRPPRQQLLQLHAPAICFSGGAWATRACDSPSLLGLLFWHEPFCFLAWFPSRRVMVDVNLPKRTA